MGLDRREDRGRMPYAGVGACFVCVGVGGWVGGAASGGWLLVKKVHDDNAR